MAGAKIYEGKAKILFATDRPDVYIAHYKDDATAFNAQKRGQIEKKGEMNCAIATYLFEYLAAKGIPTHFIAQIAPDRMQVAAVHVIPLEVVVRNLAAGSLCKQTGLALGTVLPRPIVEFYYKNDALGDPLLTPDRLELLALATPEQVEAMRQMALQINEHLQAFFGYCELTLVDFKLEFGIDGNGTLLLCDEISPDTCRLWDRLTDDPQARVLDKDRFREDLGNVADAYQEVLTRVHAVVAQKLLN